MVRAWKKGFRFKWKRLNQNCVAKSRSRFSVAVTDGINCSTYRPELVRNFFHFKIRQGQGDLLGSGSLLHPQISQRPFNSVQGANALRGDPQISIGDIPSIAAPSNPVQSNTNGLN